MNANLINLIALVLTFILALAWLRLCDYAAHRGWIGSQLSRKIIHIGTGPIYVLCWLLFKDTPTAPYLASLVPFAITIQFALVGLGVIHDEAAVKAMSRTGNRREILQGPLYYGIIFVILTIAYWKRSPIGIIALMLLCGGDGLADVLGRRYGSTKIPWNPNKSWAGSLGMILGSWVFPVIILAVYITMGVFHGPISAYLPAITLIAIAGTIVETLPIKDLDNITITLIAIIMGHILL
jgi:phytol kinase